MNTRLPRPSTQGSVAERDWLAQEQALEAPSRRADALLARALHSQPLSQPPQDFAAGVAALAAAAPRPQPADARLERGLLQALLATLAVAAMGTLGYFGGQWWALASQALGTGAAQWALLGATCLLLSWLPEAARRLRAAAWAAPA